MSARPASGRESLPSFPAPLLAALHGDLVPTASADPDRPPGHVPAPVAVLDEESFDASIPNVARVYDCLLGGKDNFAADRQAAARLLEAVPGAAVAARENRAFLGRAVRFLAREAGICQFLDLGTGLPTVGSVHEIAQADDPRRVRVVYADYDPVVVRHAEAILGGSLTTAVVRADLRQPWGLLAQPTVRTMINLAQPVAILLVAALHFVDDHEDPWAVVNCYKDLMAPGSFLVISHVTADHLSPGAARQARDVYAGASAPGVARTRERIAAFFAGLDMVAPGLANVSAWRADHIGAPPGPALFYAGIGRKSAPGRPR
jgi:S-adenosyl methyltransferase